MKSLNLAPSIARSFALVALCGFAAALPLRDAKAVAASPFAALVGWWNGQGILGYKASPPEKVKCHATYFANDSQELKQTIRCATAAGAVEVVSNVKEAGDKLTGHWKETIHNFEGDLTGEVTPKGFRIQVRGADISANMDIAVQGDKQVVEIQFSNSSLIGLSLIMTKGGA